MAEVELIVKSKIKEVVKELNVAGDVPEALNKKVIKLLEEACERAKANGRRTLQARDL
ncbi:MAG: NFYB/HAP3 family transcription factor subunit [Candidatus Pacearchaeota archaeon]